MATIEVYEDSYTTRHTITLDIYHDDSSYPDDHSENATVTFPVPHLPGEIVEVEYSDFYGQDVLTQVARDIKAYLENPRGWTEEMIKKGVGSTLELRSLENELAEDKREHERYIRYADEKTEHIKRVEQRIAEHKAKHGLE